MISNFSSNIKKGEENYFHKNGHNKHNKKTRFISNARGFGKKGIFGRGTHIREDQFTYFVNILATMKDDEELDKVAMANNVFNETCGQEIHLCTNQIVSQVIEALIGFTAGEHFERFLEIFLENMRPICSDPYASHVIQKLVAVAFLRSVDDNQIESCDSQSVSKKRKANSFYEANVNASTVFLMEHRKTCQNFVLNVGKYLLNNLEDFLWDPYANHIMRTTISALAGLHSAKLAFQHNKSLSNFGSDFHQVTVPPQEWTHVVKDYANRLQLWPQFSDLPYDELSSGFLASLCVSLKFVDKKLLKHFGKKILVDGFLNANKEVKPSKESVELDSIRVFDHAPSIRLLEALLSCAGPKLFSHLYTLLFKGKIATLALGRSTNFAVQKLICYVKQGSDFQSIFEELAQSFEEILKVGHTGIVLFLSDACLRFGLKQAAFVSALQIALHTVGSKEKADKFLDCVLKFMPYELSQMDSSQFIHIHIHGSVIIQTMLKFNKPIKLVQILLETDPHVLVTLFSTPNGSFIADAFLESKFVGEKSREKLIRCLQGRYVDMAVTRFGSRVVEKLFETANDALQKSIAKELADRVNQLKGTQFGRVVYSKLRIETYKQRSASQWKASFDRVENVDM